MEFEWDEKKNEENIRKHGISLYLAQVAFDDNKCVIIRDIKHSNTEERYHCIGKVEGEIITVRFTYRNGIIRIIGAGYWRQGRKIYEKENA